VSDEVTSFVKILFFL